MLKLNSSQKMKTYQKAVPFHMHKFGRDADVQKFIYSVERTVIWEGYFEDPCGKS